MNNKVKVSVQYDGTSNEFIADFVSVMALTDETDGTEMRIRDCGGNVTSAEVVEGMVQHLFRFISTVSDGANMEEALLDRMIDRVSDLIETLDAKNPSDPEVSEKK